MRQSDRPRLADIAGALRLLTRLPLSHSSHIPSPGAAWAWPLAGAVVGAITAAFAAGLMVIAPPLSAGVIAGIALGAQVMLTGAMHEDGLADTADGFWGGWDKTRRLEIMKDSHIGTYGVMALIVVTGIRWACLTVLIGLGQWGALVVVAALSRAPMAVLIVVLPSARGAGLAHSVGRVPAASAGFAVLIAAGFALMLGGAGLAALLAAGLAVTALALLARAKIGGQTGDVLGAAQQLAEAAALTALVMAI